MNLLDLSKEQKQYLVLGVIVAIVLAILIIFGIKVSLSSISEARLELQDLAAKIETAEESLSKSQQGDAEFRATIAELTAHLANIPPDRNYYSWATEIIYIEARMVHFEIDAVDEIIIAAPVDNSKEQDQVKLESYSLRITARGGYENIKRFLQQITRNHPLVRVTGIEISSGSTPEIHDVQLFIEWPFDLSYITESWKSISEKKPESSRQEEAPKVAPPSEPVHEPESEQPVLEKTPTPPAPRPESTPQPVQAAPTAAIVYK